MTNQMQLNAIIRDCLKHGGITNALPADVTEQQVYAACAQRCQRDGLEATTAIYRMLADEARR